MRCLLLTKALDGLLGSRVSPALHAISRLEFGWPQPALHVPSYVKSPNLAKLPMCSMSEYACITNAWLFQQHTRLLHFECACMACAARRGALGTLLGRSFHMTHDLCHTMALAAGLPHFGVLGDTCRGSEAFTLDPTSYQMQDIDCATPCPGDPTLPCGGHPFGYFTLFTSDPTQGLTDHAHCVWGAPNQALWTQPMRLTCLETPDCTYSPLPTWLPAISQITR